MNLIRQGEQKEGGSHFEDPFHGVLDEGVLLMRVRRKAHLQQFIHRSTLFNVELETSIHEADKLT